MNIYIDIETIPAQRPDVLEDIKANIKPPATYKKPESIAEWMEKEGPTAIDEAYRKTGLDGAYGQVCVVGLACNEMPPFTLQADDWRDAGAESRLLSTLCGALSEMIPPRVLPNVCMIGHNISSFDLRFLVQRHIVNGVRPHPALIRAAQAKPWEGDRVFDTMVQWTGSVGIRVSLDKLCRALSVPTPKDGITGATVWDAVKEGHIDEVAAYCAKDVVATREVHQHMTFRHAELA